MKILKEIDGLVSSQLNVIKTVVSIFKLESRLAGLAVYPLLLNVGMLLCVFLTLWISFNVLLGYLASLLLKNIALAIIFVILFNLGISFVAIHWIKLHLKKMSFEQTRNYFAKKGDEDEGDTARINCSNSTDGKEIALPPNEGTRA